jgi:phospholipid-binding lipoprotein MlaA
VAARSPFSYREDGAIILRAAKRRRAKSRLGLQSLLGLAALVLLLGCALHAPAARAEITAGSPADGQQTASVADPEASPATGDAAVVPDTQAAASATSASTDPLELELDDRPTSFPDPLESLNRRTFSLNQTVDHWFLSPVTRAYTYVVPDRARRSVRDFFANLESPAIFVNDVLQGEFGGAAKTVARFSVNTTLGLAGLFDPATTMGLEKHNADFGQTLARQGVSSGPFLIVPLLGPTTVRDGIGTLVDVAMQPTIYLLGPTPLFVASVQEGTEGFTLREQHGEDMKRLEQASLDYYAALRSAYYQNRMATLADTPPGAAAPAASAEPEHPHTEGPPT